MTKTLSYEKKFVQLLLSLLCGIFLFTTVKNTLLWQHFYRKHHFTIQGFPYNDKVLVLVRQTISYVFTVLISMLYDTKLRFFMTFFYVKSTKYNIFQRSRTFGNCKWFFWNKTSIKVIYYCRAGLSVSESCKYGKHVSDVPIQLDTFYIETWKLLCGFQTNNNV